MSLLIGRRGKAAKANFSIESVRVREDPFIEILDAIGEGSTYQLDLATTAKIGGGRLATSQPPGNNEPENVPAKQFSGCRRPFTSDPGKRCKTCA